VMMVWPLRYSSRYSPIGGMGGALRVQFRYFLRYFSR